MSTRRLFALSIALLFSLIVAACGGGKDIPQANSVESLGDALKAAGMRVNGPNANDLLSANYFSIPGVQFTASGETVFAYEFDTPDEMTTQRGLVSPDGWGIGPKYIQWITGPTYYQNGNLIVIYDGDKSLMMETLAAAMGEPFAGGSPA